MDRECKIILYVLLAIDRLIKVGYLEEDSVIEPVHVPDKRKARRALKGFEPTEDEILATTA